MPGRSMAESSDAMGHGLSRSCAVRRGISRVIACRSLASHARSGRVALENSPESLRRPGCIRGRETVSLAVTFRHAWIPEPREWLRIHRSLAERTTLMPFPPWNPFEGNAESGVKSTQNRRFFVAFGSIREPRGPAGVAGPVASRAVVATEEEK